MTITELIVLSIRRREPKARKPVAAIVVQIMGDFFLRYFRGRCSATKAASIVVDLEVPSFLPRAVDPLWLP